MTSGLTGAIEPFEVFIGISGFGAEVDSGTASLAGTSRSFVDLDGTGSDNRLISVPGVGGDANSLYELSVILGIFQGNLLNDMQQKMIARDQISAG